MKEINDFFENFKKYSNHLRDIFLKGEMAGTGVKYLINDSYQSLKDCYRDFEDEKIGHEDIQCVLDFFDIKLLEFLGFGIHTGYKISEPELKGKKIVLYGSGQMARDMIAFNDMTMYCNIVRWVDNRKNPACPECILLDEAVLETIHDYDYYYIAIYSKGLAMARKNDLIALGIDEKKIITARPALFINGIGRAFKKEMIFDDSYTFDVSKKNFLITGAQFHNSGAQAMLFAVISEIRRRWKDAEIWYLPIDNRAYYSDELIKRYNFHFIRNTITIDSELFQNFSNLSGILDVSGYVLRNDANILVLYSYIAPLLAAYLFQIPCYLLPQSFGDFNWSKELEQMMKILLESCRIIYARESTGENILKNKFHLENVRCSCDLVLASGDIKKEFILNESDVAGQYADGCHNVAIVPNIRNYEFGNKKELLHLYKESIEKMLGFGKKVYIIMHSADEIICEDIYSMFSDNADVEYIEKEMDCIEYSEFIEQFDYAIVSRYHGIVHAYKKRVPCILLGWDYKYENLAEIMGQTRYFFDVRNDIDKELFLDTLDDLETNFEKEKEVIGNALEEIGKNNCFCFLDSDY